MCAAWRVFLSAKKPRLVTIAVPTARNCAEVQPINYVITDVEKKRN